MTHYKWNPATLQISTYEKDTTGVTHESNPKTNDVTGYLSFDSAMQDLKAWIARPPGMNMQEFFKRLSMARPAAEGLSYFPLNCDTDSKEESVVAAFGNDGLAVYITLWRLAYKDRSGEVDLSEPYKVKAVARKCNVSVAKFSRILALCLKENLFSSEIFLGKSAVTSSGIKKRIEKILFEREAAKARKAKQTPQIADNSSPNNPPLIADEPPNKPRTTPESIERERETESKDSGGRKRPRFVAPTPDDVKAFFREQRFGDPDREGQKFWNYYENADWHLGSRKMKDWRLAAHNWNARNFKPLNAHAIATENRRGSQADRAGFSDGPEGLAKIYALHADHSSDDPGGGADGQ